MISRTDVPALRAFAAAVFSTILPIGVLATQAAPAIAQQQQASDRGEQPRGAERDAAPDLEELAARIEAARADWQVPGVGVAIVKDGEVVLAEGFGVRHLEDGGEVDADTLFAIGSASKAFTATAVGMLVDDEQLDWDDEAGERLPGFTLFDPYATREITIRDLLCHRSGLSRGDLLW